VHGLRKAVPMCVLHCSFLASAVNSYARSEIPTSARKSEGIPQHTTAMHLLQSGVDITVIAMWLGHESTGTTHQYIEANLSMKERALARLQELPSQSRRYKPSDKLLAFLDGL